MKKMFIGAVILAFAMALNVGQVGAAEICADCPGKFQPVGHVPMQTVVEQQAATCRAFDYDEDDTNAAAGAIVFDGTTGYCPTEQTRIDQVNPDQSNWRLIFAICNCPNPARDFAINDLIGIRMTILTKGVYFSENLDTINFSMFNTFTRACAGTDMDRTFGTIDFYSTPACDRDKTAVPLDRTSTVCNVPNANKAVAVMSDVNQGYLITAADIQDNLSYWWINLPAMRINPSEATVGDTVRVKIELLNARLGGICAACEAVCECVIDVAIIGCVEGQGPTNCIYFPYVLTQSSPWATGIAITNLSETATVGDMEATFTLYDNTGKKFTSTMTNFTKKVNAWMLDDMVQNWTWTTTPAGTPAVGAAWLKVEANFPIDGYEFNTDGNFGAGTQPRQVCP